MKLSLIQIVPFINVPRQMEKYNKMAHLLQTPKVHRVRLKLSVLTPPIFFPCKDCKGKSYRFVTFHYTDIFPIFRLKYMLKLYCSDRTGYTVVDIWLKQQHFNWRCIIQYVTCLPDSYHRRSGGNLHPDRRRRATGAARPQSGTFDVQRSNNPCP